MSRGDQLKPLPRTVASAAWTIINRKPPADRLPDNPKMLKQIIGQFVGDIDRQDPTGRKGAAVRRAIAEMAWDELVTGYDFEEALKDKDVTGGVFGVTRQSLRVMRQRDVRQKVSAEKLRRLLNKDPGALNPHDKGALLDQSNRVKWYLKREGFAKEPSVGSWNDWLKMHWDPLCDEARGARWCCDLQLGQDAKLAFELHAATGPLAKRPHETPRLIILARWHRTKLSTIRDLLKPSRPQF